MSSKQFPPVSHLPDADMQAAPSALVRAAQRARELAARTGTPLVYSHNGRLFEKQATLTMGEDQTTTESVPDA
jgi:hypothetical protein